MNDLVFNFSSTTLVAAGDSFDWAQFFGLFNYWIVIFLMMTGFYIVIARENLIKTIIGLNIFQTSVFLLYITMGKVKGGTTPIIHPSKVKHHGHGHEDHGAQHAGEHGHALLESENVNGITKPVDSILPASFDETIAHSATANHVEQHTETAIDHAHEAAHHAVDLVELGGPFSNPLPSVLMLTAIVVGIATTALALALIVRIREDYGTIEEDEILEIDRNDSAQRSDEKRSNRGRGSKEKKRKS